LEESGRHLRVSEVLPRHLPGRAEENLGQNFQCRNRDSSMGSKCYTNLFGNTLC
jgi:hypothetical protein